MLAQSPSPSHKQGKLSLSFTADSLIYFNPLKQQCHYSDKDQIEMSSTSLFRLRKQRQKIQQLTQLYEKQRKQLLRYSKKQSQWQQQIYQLQQLRQFRVLYDELKVQYQALFTQLQLKNYDQKSLKKDLEQANREHQQKLQALKLNIKMMKNQFSLQSATFKQQLQEKQQKIGQLTHKIKLKEIETNSQIIRLQEENKKLNNRLKIQVHDQYSVRQGLKLQTRMKDLDSMAYDKIIQSLQRENIKLKTQNQNLDDQLQSICKQHQVYSTNKQLQVEQFNRLLKEKNHQIYSLKQKIAKIQNKNVDLEKANQQLTKVNIKINKNIDSKIRNIHKIKEEEKYHYQDQICRLKKQIQKQIQEYNFVSMENKKLRRQLQKRQYREQNRRQRISSEFKSIDRLQKSLKK